MNNVVLKRTKENELGTFGNLKDIGIFSIELPWKDNQSNISCIPTGTYKVIPYSSEKFPDCFAILDVPGRANILIHPGNTIKDTHGCICVGLGQNLDGVFSSKKAVSLLREKFPKGFNLTIEAI